MIRAGRRWLAERLMHRAVARLRRRHPDFAEAMLGEVHGLGEGERLRWAAGCYGASLRVCSSAEALAYPLALVAGVGAMTAYQWSADENVMTLALVCVIGLALGLVDPKRFLLSGLLVGAVVTGVNAFETFTGIRPAYEAATHGLAHDLRWMALAPPAVLSAALGRALSLRLHSGRPSFHPGD